MISICITVKDRTRVPAGDRMLRPFVHSIESLTRAAATTPCELIVTDWQSRDVPVLSWLPRAVGAMPLTTVRLAPDPFSRGYGLNQAARWAGGETLFFLDADILLTSQVLCAAEKATAAGRAFFPICYSYDNVGHTRGHWRQEGYGLLAVSRDMFTRVGGWDVFTQWGGEDRRMVQRIRAAGIEIERMQCDGLYHQWHPTTGSLTNAKGHA